MIKVDIISGFLGAGKTTLIKKLFEDAFKNERIVLIENEFGEIGVDGAFLKDSGIKIKEINSGCICCSLVGDFTSSMKEVVSKYNPERIIIEPSGVGKLSDIVSAVLKVDLPLSVNILATVVDGTKCRLYMKNFGEFFNNQVESADTIIISKTDKMTDEQIDAVVLLLKEKNKQANIVTTPIQKLDGVKLLNVLETKTSLKEDLIKDLQKSIHEKEEHEHECHCHDDEDEEHKHECHCHDDEDEEHEHECHCHDDEDEEHEHECHCHDDEDEEHEHECHCHHHHHDHDADEVFTSWGIETPKAVSKIELDKFLHTLATNTDLGIIVRAKGILKANDANTWYYFDYVMGDYEIRTGNADYTGRICVIGSKLNSEKVEKLFFEKE